MKFILNSATTLYLLVMISSCQKINQRIKPDGFVEKEVYIKAYFMTNSPKPFAKVKLFVPIEFDTLQVWADESDCSGCEINKYRFSYSNSCLIQESGFFKIAYCKDSINRCTIEHQVAGPEAIAIDSTSLINHALYLTQKYTQNGLQFHRIERINGRDFMLFRFTCKYPVEDVETFLAITYIGRDILCFVMECKQHDCSNFESRSFTILRSILIDTIP